MQLTWWQIPYPQALYAGKQNRIITNWPSLGILSGYNQCTAWYMCCVISSVNKISLYNLRKRTFPASDYFHDYWQRETRHRTIFHELNYLVVGEGEGEVELLKTCRQGWVTQGLNLSGYHLCLSHSVSVGVKVIDTFYHFTVFVNHQALCIHILQTLKYSQENFNHSVPSRPITVCSSTHLSFKRQ